jgi:hypothetical protein
MAGKETAVKKVNKYVVRLSTAERSKGKRLGATTIANAEVDPSP